MQAPGCVPGRFYGVRAVVFKVGAELAALAGGVPLGLGLAPGWAVGRGFASLAAEWVQREGELARCVVGVALSMSNYGQACSQQCKACFLGNACNGG